MPGRYTISPAVQAKLKESNLTADEVLRKALHIKLEGLQAADDVYLAEGTAIMQWYKNRPYWGFVREGMLEIEIDGKVSRVPSVSAAAAKVTGRPTTNGWDFWLVKLPGKNDFVPLKEYRKK